MSDEKKPSGTRYVVFEDYGDRGLKVLGTVFASSQEQAVRLAVGPQHIARDDVHDSYVVVPETNLTPVNLSVVTPEPKVTLTKVDAQKWVSEKVNLAAQATVTQIPGTGTSATGGFPSSGEAS